MTGNSLLISVNEDKMSFPCAAKSWYLRGGGKEKVPFQNGRKPSKDWKLPKPLLLIP